MRTMVMLTVLLLPTLGQAAGPAAADGKAPEEAALEKARGLAKLGQRLYDTGQFAGALEKYQAAYDLRQEPALLFNIGQCHRMLRDHQRAVIAYRAYLRENPRAANRAAVEELLAEEQRAAALDPGGARPESPGVPRANTPPETPPPTSALPPSEPPAVVSTPPGKVALDPGPTERKGSGSTLALGATALALGAAGVGLGAWLIAIDHTPTTQPVPPKELAPERYATMTGGVTALAAGAVGIVGGLVGVLYGTGVIGGRKAPPSTTAGAWIAPGGGGGVTVLGRF